MKPFTGAFGQIQDRDLVPDTKSITSLKGETPAEMQPTFTLTFTLGTPMDDIADTVIRTVLQFARGNRLRAAQLLKINPRTIRRRLGRKESRSSAPLAA